MAAAGQAHRGPDILTPILLAFSIASILDPVVDWLAAWHVPRPAAIALVLGGTLGPGALVLVLVVPGIATDVAGGLQEMPTQLAGLWSRTASWLAQHGSAVPHTPTEWVARLHTLASEGASHCSPPPAMW